MVGLAMGVGRVCGWGSASYSAVFGADVLGLHQVKRYGVDGVGLGGARERVCFAERN